MSDQRRGPKWLGFILKAAAITATGVFVLLVIGIAVMYVSPGVKGSTSGTLASGCVVDVYSDGIYLATGVDGDTATIHTGIGEVTVLPAEVLIDKVPVCRLPDGVENVSVHRESGRLRIAADGQDMYTSEKLWW
jgi:hypothetical protein